MTPGGKFHECVRFFPVAMGLLKHPEDDLMDSRYLPNEKPHQRTKPKVGESAEEDMDIASESEARGVDDSPKTCPDKWELRGDYLVRVHVEPRMALYVPDETCPLMHSWLDVDRETKTSLLHDDEAVIRDMWSPNEVQPSLSNQWVGETRFTLIKPRAKEGYEYQNGK